MNAPRQSSTQRRATTKGTEQASMTEHDVNVARDIGGLQADMRTVKHDVANISAKMDGGFNAITAQLTTINLKREKSLGFIAGASAVVTVFATLLAAALKLIFGAHG